MVLLLAGNKYHPWVLVSLGNSSAQAVLGCGYLLRLHFAFLFHPSAPPLCSRLCPGLRDEGSVQEEGQREQQRGLTREMELYHLQG